MCVSGDSKTHRGNKKNDEDIFFFLCRTWEIINETSLKFTHTRRRGKGQTQFNGGKQKFNCCELCEKASMSEFLWLCKISEFPQEIAVKKLNFLLDLPSRWNEREEKLFNYQFPSLLQSLQNASRSIMQNSSKKKTWVSRWLRWNFGVDVNPIKLSLTRTYQSSACEWNLTERLKSNFINFQEKLIQFRSFNWRELEEDSIYNGGNFLGLFVKKNNEGNWRKKLLKW